MSIPKRLTSMKRKPMANAHLGIAGIVQSVKLIESTTGEVELELGPYSNMIVDAGLDGLGSANNTIATLADKVAVGTGATPPAAGQTSLDAQLGGRYTRTGSPSFVYVGPYWERTVSYSIPAGSSTGSLAEFGLFRDASAGIMWSRQLFVDALGDPVTINKTATKILQITYKVRMYPNLVVDTEEIIVDLKGTPTPTDVTWQPNDVDGFGWQEVVNNWGAWGGFTNHIGNLYTWPDNTPPGSFTVDGPATATGKLAQVTSASTPGAYVAGTYYRDKIYSIPIGSHNQPGGIGAMSVSSTGQVGPGTMGYIMFFDPKLAKTSSDTLVVTVRWSWGRYVP